MLQSTSYRWIVLAAAFGQLASCYTAWYSFSVFLVALVSDLGWSRADTSVAQSLLIVGSGLGAPLAGWLVDRLGPRLPVLAGAVLLGAGTALSSVVQEPWHFYLLYGVIGGIGTALCGWVTATAVLVLWFPRQRASALGAASAGIGVGMLVFVPLTQQLVSAFGWRTAYVVVGLGIGAVGVLSGLLMRMPARPPARTASQRASSAADDPLVVDRAWAATVWTVNRAIRTRRFWYVSACFFCGSLAMQQILAHQVAILVDVGFDRLFGALTVGVVGVCSIFGKLSWGYISDRVGREIAYSLGQALLVASLGTLALAGLTGQPALALGFALLFGLGYAVTAVLSPATVADCFQGRHFGTVFGLVAIGHGIGGAIGAWTTGFLRDTAGSYGPALLLSAVLCGVAAGLCWLAAPRKVRLVPGRLSRRPAAAV